MWLFASSVTSICSADNSVSLTPLGFEEDDRDDDDDVDDDDKEEEEEEDKKEEEKEGDDLIFCPWNNCSSSNSLPFGKLQHQFQIVLWPLIVFNDNDPLVLLLIIIDYY